jgi:GNAT superfamily N-acetyltransferase
MKIRGVKGSGIKVFIKDGEKEIARAYLYILHNGLHEEPFGLLEDVYVDENFRGKGLGTNVVNKIIELARKNKCYKLIATSRHSRPKVHELYRKIGFEDWGREFRMDF